MEKKLELKSIYEVLEKIFYIPAYQRGYRWSSRQVTDLLEDIMEFASKKTRNELEVKEFYCLQPIVVKNENNEYRVIDGQQRLTTIYIILKYLEAKIKDDFYIEKFYTIEYETRNKTYGENESFLEKINTIKDQIDTTEVDYYYMSNTYITIQNWFIDNKVNKGDFLNVLLKSDIQTENDEKIDLANNIRVIWYEIESEDEIEVFTRLNIGKIPLTNAELIKALFLININNSDTNENILLSSEWDDIEYKLQGNDFFSFINKNSENYDKKYPTRIEYIFNLMANNISINIPNLQSNDEKRSYYIFNELIKNEQNSKKYWDEAKKYFRVFNELYQNNTYYHLVGYLIHNGMEIQIIVDAFIEKSKESFIQFLNKKISDTTRKSKKGIHDLTYGIKSDENIISKILFLFNVVSTMQGEYSRYPFNLHQSEQWSLEHIHAQNSEIFTSDDDRKELLKSQVDYIVCSTEKKTSILKQKINTLIESKNIDEDEFNEVQNEIFELYSDDIGTHTIDNLALLSRDDNASLNNSIFPAKRDKIKQLDKNGSFIPITTKNVFLKYYSDDVRESLTWNKKDRESYFREMMNVLECYIGDSQND
jgi:uncharacterized protein with ParB-like and HNH nuclease domain